MTIEEVLQHDEQFRYMLLDRLKQDCLYFINGGCYQERLWAGNVIDHIAYMRAIWKSFPKGSKPEWITKKEIDKLEHAMLKMV